MTIYAIFLKDWNMAEAKPQEYFTSIRQAVRTACALMKSARQWLNTAHDYSNEEGQIFLTGWQYVGIACALTVSAFLVSCLG